MIQKDPTQVGYGCIIVTSIINYRFFVFLHMGKSFTVHSQTGIQGDPLDISLLITDLLNDNNKNYGMQSCIDNKCTFDIQHFVSESINI